MFKKKETPEADKLINDKTNEINKLKKEVFYWKGKRRKHIWVWRVIYYFIKDRKGQPQEKDWKSKEKIAVSIYPRDKTLGNYCKHFNWVHRFLKSLVFLPALNILYWLIGKRLDKDVEDEWYNKNVKIFNNCWLESLDILGKYLNPGMPTSKSYEITRRMALSFILNDSVTKEFVNVFMHTVKMRMEEAYKGHKQVYHVFYTDSVSYNPQYFTMVKAVMQQNIHPSEAQHQMLNNQEKALDDTQRKLVEERKKIVENRHIVHVQQQAEQMTKKLQDEGFSPKEINKAVQDKFQNQLPMIKFEDIKKKEEPKPKANFEELPELK